MVHLRNRGSGNILRNRGESGFCHGIKGGGGGAYNIGQQVLYSGYAANTIEACKDANPLPCMSEFAEALSMVLKFLECYSLATERAHALLSFGFALKAMGPQH